MVLHSSLQDFCYLLYIAEVEIRIRCCLAKAYANHPWSVTEPEAVGVPGWQTGPLSLITSLPLLVFLVSSLEVHELK